MQGGISTFTVSRLSSAIKRLITDTFSCIKVEGEVINYIRSSAGHLYFSLKEENAVLDVVCWKDNAKKLLFEPKNGMSIYCKGHLTTYNSKSKYQLTLVQVESLGEGSLKQIAEELRNNLAKEGLFDLQHKKPIPKYIFTVGIVTSMHGAVIRDILHRLKERFPCMVHIQSCSVQGIGAAEEISQAIQRFNDKKYPLHPKPQVLIVARGGGSMEELWAFNEEAVVRAIYNSEIPVVSAIGHEKDHTLTDMVSDLSAPTPTAAAEIITSHPRNKIIQDILLYNSISTNYIRNNITILNSKIEHNFISNYSYNKILYNYLYKVRYSYQSITNKLLNKIRRASLLQQYIFIDTDELLIKNKILNIDKTFFNITQHIKFTIQRISYKINLTSRGIKHYSIADTLKRGFAVARNSNNELIRSIKQIKTGEEISITLHEGTITAKTTNITQ